MSGRWFAGTTCTMYHDVQGMFCSPLNRLFRDVFVYVIVIDGYGLYIYIYIYILQIIPKIIYFIVQKKNTKEIKFNEGL